MVKIGSPLFILREECAKSLPGVLERIAEIGFDGVEFVSLFGYKVSEVKSKLDSCGLKAIGDHVSFDEFSKNTQKVIDDHKELGCKYITLGSPGADGFSGSPNYKHTLETIHRIGEAMNESGMKLLYHNHAEELRQIVDGKAVLEHLFDDTDPDLLQCELDLGWIGIGGGDPIYFYKKYGERCPVVHYKDYMLTDDLSVKDERGFLFRPTGYGVMNFSLLYDMSTAHSPDWYIMDHDLAYSRDSYFELEISLDYFKNLMKTF